MQRLIASSPTMRASQQLSIRSWRDHSPSCAYERDQNLRHARLDVVPLAVADCLACRRANAKTAESEIGCGRQPDRRGV
jgi:hypothetical protein